jgi:predicted MPP superfamily phosphohydrolase
MNPNRFVPSIILLLGVLDLLVMLRMYVLLGRTVHRRAWRGLLFAWLLGTIGFCAVAAFHSILLGSTRNPVPRFYVAVQYIWHFLALPLLAVGLSLELIYQAAARSVRRARRKAPAGAADGQAEAPAMPAGAAVSQEAVEHSPVAVVSRRHFLTSTALVAAPIATAGLAGVSLSQLGKFRIRTFDLALPAVPRALDNYSITVIADVHVGVFSTPQMLQDIVAASNRLNSNLVLLPGDLINISHGDLPGALDMVSQLRSRDGVYLIEGNHDDVQGPEEFDEIVRRSGFNILVDEITTINAREYPFQLMGTRWIGQDEGRDASVAYTAGLRDPNIFSIMMAHHPHSWDPAADAGVPLVIAGHAHGGQIMLTPTIGAGPIKFKYWTGRYDRPGSTLVVSNGVGNWFPLRVNAPAEILRINLHPA